MYHVGICDDSNAVRDNLEKMLLQYGEEKGIETAIQIWNSGEDIKDYLEQGGMLDILFLDIQLMELSGIAVGNFIRNELENRDIQIVYISSECSYAMELFKTQPTDFLLKPILYDKLSYTMDIVIKIIKKATQKFTFSWDKNYYYVPERDILYMETDGRKIKIVCRHKEYVFYGKLKDALEQLSGDFIMIHQSFLVNRTHITCYHYEYLEMANGQELAISRSYRKKVREIVLSKHWGQ